MTYLTYDAWRCSPPDPQHPDPPDTHDACEDALEHAEDEIGLLHRQVEELEIELAAARGRASERMTYGELFSAVHALLPRTSFTVAVSTNRFVHALVDVQPAKTSWRITWFLREDKPDLMKVESVDCGTAEEALAAFKLALVNAPVPAGDPTGVSDLVRDADVGF